MYSIKTRNSISDKGLCKLAAPVFTVGDEESDPHGILVRSSQIDTAELTHNLLCIARAGAGYNNIPVDECTKRGIVAFNTPGANANAVKELTVAALVASCRNLDAGVAWVKTLKGRGGEVPALVEKGKGQFVGPEIRGKTLGVIGLGAIGVLVANAAVHLGMDVYGYDPYISIEAAWNLSRSVKHCVNLSDIIARCDVITLHLPVNSETKGFVNSAIITNMKDGVRILNFARGDLVVSADILNALTAGKLSCYVTDFPTDDLLCCEGVLAIPHLGASTPESEENCAVMAAAQTAAYLMRGEINNSVNMPNVQLDAFKGSRICIFNQNKAGMLSAITACASEAGFNIENLINRSRGEIAYTVLDIPDKADEKLSQKFMGIDGVIRTRIIYGA